MLQRQKSLATDNSHQIMRCVIDEKGSLSFISPALAWSLGVNGGYLLSSPAIEFMDIVGNAKIYKKHTKNRDDRSLREIGDGFHNIVLFRRGRDPLLVETRVDNVIAPDGKKYKVLWMEPDKTGGKKDDIEFDKIAYQIADIASRLSKYRNEKVNDDKRTITDEEHEKSKIDDGELRNFLNISNDLVAVYDRKGSFLRVNYAFNRILGYTDDDLRPIPFLDLIDDEDHKHAERHMKKVMLADPDVEVRVDFEAKTKAKDGGIRWIEWVQKSAKNIVYIVGRDVTSIKQQEVELEWREQQLSEAQKIGKMGHWHWVVGDDIVGWSDQIYSIFGVNKNKFIPTLESINTCMVERDIGTLFRSFKRAIVDKTDFSIEYCLKHPNEEIRYVRCQGRCQVNEKTGEIEALFGIMQDITERTLHEKALNEAKEAAEAAYASKTRFLANMSHELRTPLNAIIGFSEMMQRQLLGPLGNDRYMDYIGGIRESGEHLLDLINDILDMAKIEVGKYTLELEEINISKLIRLAAHMMEGRAQETNINIQVKNLPEDLQMIADRRAVMQILLNILSNAIKFTGDNGKVTIECEENKDKVKVTIADNGIGIPKEKIDLVVMPFEQAGGALTRKHEGSGLGLSITKDLVEMHGGHISIISKVGSGTNVSLLFPKVAVTKESKEEQS